MNPVSIRPNGWFSLRWWFMVLSIILGLSIFLGVSLGPVSIPLSDVWRIAAFKLGLIARGDWSGGTENIVWLIRFPRVLLASVVGAGLAVVGVTLQSLVRNTLADSYILGISSGASVGAVVSIAWGVSILGESFGISVGAFIGALVAFGLVLLVASREGHITPDRLILSGVGIGYMFSGITSLFVLTSNKKQLAGQILSWTLGSLARATWFDLTLPTLILIGGIFYLFLQARHLNALTMGDETAITLGINVNILRRNLFITTALITGVMVTVSGSIGFIGLMVPHLVRLFTGYDHRRVLPISALIGSIFLIWVDTISRTAFKSAELPVGVITFILGGLFFLWIFWKTHQHSRHNI